MFLAIEKKSIKSTIETLTWRLAISVNIKTQIACHNFFFKFNCLALEATESLIYFGSDS